MKILAFAASLRKESLNRKLIELAADVARGHGAEVDLAEFSEFDMPLYNGDIDGEEKPAGAAELKRRIEGADSIMIASPEYNFSMPGTLKNAIDWVSRYRPMPTRGKTGMLLAASTGLVGGIRGLWQLRIPLEGIGITLHPDMFALASAGKAFAEDGTLLDEKLHERLDATIAAYVAMATALRKKE